METIMRTEEVQAHGEVSNILQVQQKLKDLKSKLNDEIKNHTTTQKQQKKKLREIEAQYEKKNQELNDANALLIRCQIKIEKYKSKQEDDIQRTTRIEKELKRTISELQHDFEREKKAYTELQREFAKKVTEHSELSEKRLRDQYEGKIHCLEREVYEKDQQIHKANMQQLIQAQFVNTKSKPDQMERMLEVYENKIASYQRDYISKIEYQDKVKDLENKFESEMRETTRKFDLDTGYKLKQQEEAKNKEFNMTLNNIKQAVTNVENNLVQEKETNRKLLEQLDVEVKESNLLRVTIRDQEETKNTLIKNLEEATTNITRLKELLEMETRKRKESQKRVEELSVEVNKLLKHVEEVRLQQGTQEKVTNSNKQELVQLKTSLQRELLRNDEVMQEIKSNKEYTHQLEIEKGKTVDVIQSVIHFIRLQLRDEETIFNASAMNVKRTSGKGQDMDELCKELNRITIAWKEDNEKQLSIMETELSSLKRGMERMGWDRRQKAQKLEMLLREKLVQLRKETNFIKSYAEKEILTMKHMMDKLMETFIRKVKEHTYKSGTEVVTLQRALENEQLSLRQEFQEKIREKQEEMKHTLSEYQLSVSKLETKTQNLTLERGKLEKELDTFQKKYSDMQRLIATINRFIPLPIDVQTGLLSENDTVVEKSLISINSLFSDSSSKLASITDLVRAMQQAKDEVAYANNLSTCFLARIHFCVFFSFA